MGYTGARDSEWQWNLLGYMQVCTLLQTDNHASTPPLSFFTGRMPFLPPNQECQSTEGTKKKLAVEVKSLFVFSGVYVTFVLSFQLLLLFCCCSCLI